LEEEAGRTSATLLARRSRYKGDAYDSLVRGIVRPVERLVIGALMTLLAIVLERRVRSRLR